MKCLNCGKELTARQSMRMNRVCSYKCDQAWRYGVNFIYTEWKISNTSIRFDDTLYRHFTKYRDNGRNNIS